jgi:hypothetical protein
MTSQWEPPTGRSTPAPSETPTLPCPAVGAAEVSALMGAEP